MIIKKILLWIWQFPQNIAGFFLSRGASKEEYEGIKYYIKPLFRSGVSLGNYIILDPVILRFRDSYVKNSIKHEHGHQIQSLYFGPLYLILIGIPSLCGNLKSRYYHLTREWYYNQPWEKWADKLGKVER